MRDVGIPWRVHFWFPFLGVQRSNFEGSGCPLGSKSERSGRPWGSMLSSLGRLGRPCVTREPPRSPRPNFPKFPPSHFGAILASFFEVKIDIKSERFLEPKMCSKWSRRVAPKPPINRLKIKLLFASVFGCLGEASKAGPDPHFRRPSR